MVIPLLAFFMSERQLAVFFLEVEMGDIYQDIIESFKMTQHHLKGFGMLEDFLYERDRDDKEIKNEETSNTEDC